MYLPKITLTFAIAAAIAAPVTALADAPRCELLSYKPTQVVPLNVSIPVAHGCITNRLAGAQVFVPAQPGLTAEWLRASLERHIVDMKQHPMTGCPLANERISLAVVNGATGYWIQIAANDSDTAKQILRQAENLVR